MDPSKHLLPFHDRPRSSVDRKAIRPIQEIQRPLLRSVLTEVLGSGGWASRRRTLVGRSSGSGASAVFDMFIASMSHESFRGVLNEP